MAQRLKAEGENSPADVILTVDIARLYIYDDNDLLSPVKSEKLNKNIPFLNVFPGFFSSRCKLLYKTILLTFIRFTCIAFQN